MPMNLSIEHRVPPYSGTFRWVAFLVASLFVGVFGGCTDARLETQNSYAGVATTAHCAQCPESFKEVLRIWNETNRYSSSAEAMLAALWSETTVPDFVEHLQRFAAAMGTFDEQLRRFVVTPDTPELPTQQQLWGTLVSASDRDIQLAFAVNFQARSDISEKILPGILSIQRGCLRS